MKFLWFFALILISLGSLSQTTVFINEIHYDDGGADANEGVEIAAPAGTNLSCYKIVAYNGSTGAAYSTTNLSGIVPDEGCGFGAISFPITGLQNGAPDGVALVFDPSLAGCGTFGVLTVVQFLSYEGSFTAVGGDANGLTSTNIGVAEGGSDPDGFSLQLQGSGTVYGDFTWGASVVAASAGTTNAGQDFCSTVGNVSDESTTPSDATLTNTWTAPSGCSDEILVVASTSTIVNTPTGDGTAYSANATFGLGTDLGGGEFVVYKGGALGFSLSGLTNGTQYCLKVFNRCGTDWSTGVEVCSTPENYNEKLKVVAYNVLNYPGSTAARSADFKIVIDDLQPDIILCNEVLATGTGLLLTALNASGPTNWASATFVDGPDSDNILFYNMDKVTLVSQTQISTTLRDISHYQVCWTNQDAGVSFLDLFALHLKASSGATNEARRLAECQSLSTYLDGSLAANANIIVGGDFNFYGAASEPAWAELTATGTQLLYDPIEAPGEWHVDATYQAIHTQSTRSAANPGGSGGAPGGLDDRFDFIFIDDQVKNGSNRVRYVPNSYGAHGNDANKFDVSIIENLPNTSVTNAVRDALFDMSDHLPVYLEVDIDWSSMHLPVELMAFSVQKEGEGALLSWNTASEVNNDLFEVERSVDAVNWTKIAVIKGNGTSSDANHYQHYDAYPLKGTSYYRLKQIDFDSEFELSKLVPYFNIDASSEIRIAPNPIRNDQLSFVLGAPVQDELLLEVYDLSGMQVFKQTIKTNSNQLRYSVRANFQMGMYLLRLSSRQYEFHGKFLKE